MKLPVEFLNKMKNLMKENEYEEFLESYNQPRHYGLRVNTLKISVEDFLRISPFVLEPIPWTKDGFYYKEGENPGRHPYYHAGLYYIQEPSAMLPGAVIGAQPGECVLDLCAAPGGKTVQMAAAMKGQGLLVANDISADRVKALVKNIELCGVRNAVVTNETPEKLARNFKGFFDRILVDAPCSGEGMFRKDEDAARSWENFKCEKCAGMQRDILEYVDKMLKPGGYMVYSTCTFSPEEDEAMIAEFMDKQGNYEICPIPKVAGIADGRPEWADGNPELAKTARLWPHRIKGEGHFVALLRKSETVTSSFLRARHGTHEECSKIIDEVTVSPTLRKKPADVDAADRSNFANPKNIKLDPFYAFVRENLNSEIEGVFDMKGSNLYCLPYQLPDMSGLKVAKFGWYLGEFIKDKFEPSHSMVIALARQDLKNVMDLGRDDRMVFSYLKGETLMVEGRKGYAAICVDGYTLGWAKQTGDMLKNMYPKGWRKMS